MTTARSSAVGQPIPGPTALSTCDGLVEPGRFGSQLPGRPCILERSGLRRAWADSSNTSGGSLAEIHPNHREHTRVATGPGDRSQIREELPLSTRVHELAKELGLKSPELLERIQKLGPGRQGQQLGQSRSGHGRADQGVDAANRRAGRAPQRPARSGRVAGSAAAAVSLAGAAARGELDGSVGTKAGGHGRR